MKATLHPADGSRFLWILFLSLSIPAAALAGSGSVNVADLDGSNGFAVRGLDPGERLGNAVDGCDLNGDGHRDLILGSPYADPGGRADAGRAYVVFGPMDTELASFPLGSLNGTNGFVIEGVDSGDWLGYSASGVGDVNGDGIEDIVVAAPRADGLAGEAFVVFGRDTGFSATLDLATLDGTDGFVFRTNEPGAFVGGAVSGSDFNGDGFDDVLVTAIKADGGGSVDSGETYVIYGTDQGFPALMTRNDLNDVKGVILIGADNFQRTGNQVCGAGDINGDGYEDIVIGSDNANLAPGRAYVALGSASPASRLLSQLGGAHGFEINGTDPEGYLGWDVSGGVDVNGDGLDDLVLGEPGASPSESGAGRAYVIFGSDDGFAATLDASTLDGTNGFVIDGSAAGMATGSAVEGIGDANGDGLGDVLIGSIGNSNPGTAHLIYGSDSFPPSIDLSGLTPSSGFEVVASALNDQFAAGLGRVGDLNADGLDDLLIGARWAVSQQGEAYIVYAPTSCFPGTVDLASGSGAQPVLFLNHSASRAVFVDADERVFATVILPPLGGNGKFAIHANFGRPTADTLTVIPFDIGRTCFPLVLPGASPDGVWNNLGRTGKLGASQYLDGTPLADPDRAPTFLFYLLNGDPSTLPPGTAVTFQGVIADPGSSSSKGISTTNAILLEVRS